VIPLWARDYVGIPFCEKGRDHRGVDCWGALRLVLLERFHVEVPSYTEAYVCTAERAEIATVMQQEIPKQRWVPVIGPARSGDAVVFRLMNAPWHVGVMLDADSFLHADEALGCTCIERLSSFRWNRRLYGLYRHEALAA
jgi:cell wall-associated NlpC family hydrolase